MIRTQIPLSLTRPLALAAAGLLLATAACSENRPFERDSASAQAKLAMPSSLTPPISVRDVDGAPPEWKLAERVAEALRSRDIPASAANRSRTAYVLKGELRPGAERNGRSRVEVAWTLYDGTGKKVGDVAQMATVPGAAFKAPNEGVVDAMADAAAESIAPLVPSNSLQVADGIETGERKPNDRANAEKRDRVTALGRMGNNTGISKNLMSPPRREVKLDSRADAASRRRTGEAASRATPPATGEANALTAVGRYQGTSALSRNLFRTEGAAARPLPTPQAAPADSLPAATAPATATSPAAPARFDTEESLSIRPMPASDLRKPTASMPLNGTATTSSHPRPAPRAADIVKPDIATAPSRQPKQLAESTDPAPRTAAAGTTQYWIQIGANRDESASRAEWEKLRNQGSGMFDRTGNRIQRADLGARGIFYRVQVGPFVSAREAGQFCAQLKARQIDCFLAPPETARAQPGVTTRAAPPSPPATKSAEPKPEPKPATASAPPPNSAPKTVATPSAPKAEPADKPKDSAAAKKPDTTPNTSAARPETKPPANNASAEKPDAPISTAPGLPGVLD